MSPYRLIDVLDTLTDINNTVIVIEHNLEVIKCADHIIDLGPEGGDRGGMIVCEGTRRMSPHPTSYRAVFTQDGTLEHKNSINPVDVNAHHRGPLTASECGDHSRVECPHRVPEAIRHSVPIAL